MGLGHSYRFLIFFGSAPSHWTRGWPSQSALGRQCCRCCDSRQSTLCDRPRANSFQRKRKCVVTQLCVKYCLQHLPYSDVNAKKAKHQNKNSLANTLPLPSTAPPRPPDPCNLTHPSPPHKATREELAVDSRDFCEAVQGLWIEFPHKSTQTGWADFSEGIVKNVAGDCGIRSLATRKRGSQETDSRKDWGVRSVLLIRQLLRRKQCQAPLPTIHDDPNATDFDLRHSTACSLSSVTAVCAAWTGTPLWPSIRHPVLL
jgi:hypothetical protein